MTATLPESGPTLESEDALLAEPSASGPRRSVLLLILVSCGAIAAGVGYMIYSTMSEGSAFEYFKNVDEVMAAPEKYQTSRLRLHGNVVRGTIQQKRSSLDYRFAIFHKDRWIDVKYSGLVPDTFKDCAEVVVNGKLAPNSALFEAQSITAKCPSKYDAVQHATGCGTELQPKVLAARSSR
jgi:cytochrome c-type biogenesis protein CcmE